jgi:hypothetical protein
MLIKNPYRITEKLNRHEFVPTLSATCPLSTGASARPIALSFPASRPRPWPVAMRATSSVRWRAAGSLSATTREN